MTLPPAHNRKLTPAQVAEIRRLGGKNRPSEGRRADHPTHAQLAAAFGIAPSTAGAIVAGKTYREVGCDGR